MRLHADWENGSACATCMRREDGRGG